MRKMLRKPAVLAAMGWSHSTLYEKIARGEFPTPVKVSEKISAWPDDEVEAAQERLIAKRDAAKRAAA